MSVSGGEMCVLVLLCTCPGPAFTGRATDEEKTRRGRGRARVQALLSKDDDGAAAAAEQRGGSGAAAGLEISLQEMKNGLQVTLFWFFSFASAVRVVCELGCAVCVRACACVVPSLSREILFNSSRPPRVKKCAGLRVQRPLRVAAKSSYAGGLVHVLLPLSPLFSFSYSLTLVLF